MLENLNRRNFIKTTAAGVGCVSALNVCGQNAVDTKKSLCIAVIGCGGRGCTLLPEICKEQVVALVDPDKRQLNSALARIKKLAPKSDHSKIRTYSDYRKLYNEMGKELDAVVIATPNHHHAPAALLAIRLGINAYVEKPMALSLGEARQLKDEAKKYGVVTQMGQHGHSCEGARRLCEYIWAGAIGQVREVYSWSDRANGLIDVKRPPVSAVPKDLDWESWIGPAPFREYHSGLHRHSWHRWCDFGNGSIGNMGNHILDPIYWALKLGAPTSIENEEMRGGSAEYYSVSNRIRFDFPARGEMAPVKLYWYDGLAKGQTYNKKTVGNIDCVAPEAMNRPPVVVELEKKYNRNFGTNGSILVGDKGFMTIGPFGDGCRIVPEEAHRAFPMPKPTLPRIKGTHQSDFFRACRGGVPACANFDYSDPLVEIVLLGDLAMRAGPGKSIDWDGAAMRCTNQPDLNRFVKAAYRDGWKI
ncbi:MAG: Gfo/Idh/MocA family oxidoreductase [Kiritimatiellae bacterium]|jgi:predicted dehydrogenase|nr:Gfo/Idh/MocA family oxidoreductase [Kiritimatiellia bacterium]